MRILKYILSVFAVIFSLGGAQAQDAESTTGLYAQYQLEIVIAVAGLVCLAALLALFTALYALRSIAALEHPQKQVVKESWWQRFWSNINKAVPLEQEATVMTSHEYDGIKELDNKLPPWWLYGFYFTILFGVGYLLHYHVFGTGDLQEAEYEKNMAQAKAEVEAYLASQGNRIDESTVTFSDDPADLAAGKQIYDANCLVCHGAEGQGVVGPNFADKYWIHGGDMASIFATIKYGVPEKGMIPWETQLTPQQIQQVSSFIYTLEGTNPPNPKEPQGELFERGESSTTEESEAI
ncbi:MAG: cbb3-type cytochrome c oxidase N-terminal domain-containing protein [Cyclobacteriaceae bacterium]